MIVSAQPLYSLSSANYLVRSLSGRIEALVMTLGFEPGPLVSAMAAHASEGFEPGAEIIVLTPAFEDERAERAWRQLQDVFSMMKLSQTGVELKRLTIELEDFASAVLQVKALFTALKDKKVEISLTGGMRALILAVFTAYLLIDWAHVPDVEVFLEGRGMALRVPRLASAIGPKVSKRKLEVLDVMQPGTIYRLVDLCGFFEDRDRSTIYRHLKGLLKNGLVERANGGFKITPLGLIVRGLK